jgi:hypothetical protein
MLRKTHLLIAALVMIVMLVSTSAAGAYAPKAQGDEGNPAQKGFLVEGVAVAQADEKNPPAEALRSAVNLRASLTANQQRAIQEIWKRYYSDLAALARQLPALHDAVAPSTDAVAAKARVAEDNATFQAAKQANLDIQAVQARLDSDISAVLTVEQRSVHQATLAAITADASAAQVASSDQSVASSPVSPAYNPSYNSTYCYNAAYYATWAHYYGYYARIYAYYNYIYNAHGSYSPYYYLYYADIYATQGQSLINRAYFDEAFLHTDPFGRASSGRSAEATATTDAYYGQYYAHIDYNNYHYSYAYYAYYYGYYANQSAYYAYAYSAYC